MKKRLLGSMRRSLGKNPNMKPTLDQPEAWLDAQRLHAYERARDTEDQGDRLVL